MTRSWAASWFNLLKVIYDSPVPESGFALGMGRDLLPDDGNGARGIKKAP